MILSVMGLFLSADLKIGNLADLKSGFWPSLISALLLIAGIKMSLSSVDRPSDFSIYKLVDVKKISLGIALFVVLFDIMGMLISSFVLAMCLQFTVKTSTIMSVFLSLAIVLFLYLMFGVVLGYQYRLWMS